MSLFHRIIVASLFVTALAGVPSASAVIQEGPLCTSTNPTVDQLCEDLGGLTSEPCERVDCSPCNEPGECPEPNPEPVIDFIQEFFDENCPSGLNDACGVQEIVCPGGTSNTCGRGGTVNTVRDFVLGLPGQACPGGAPQLCGHDDTVDGAVDDAEDEVDEAQEEAEGRLCAGSLQRSLIASTGRLRCQDGRLMTASEDPSVPPLPLPPLPTLPDEDEDGVPDVVEEAACGSALVRNNLNVSGYVYCVTPSDLYVEPTGTFTDAVNETRDDATDEVNETRDEAVALALHYVGVAEGVALWAVGEVEDAYADVDADGDGVADEAEPWLCQVENVNFPEDGSCDEDLTDYRPPTV